MFVDFSKFNLPIELITMNEDNDILILKTSSYSYQIKAEGDCCSHSVFKTYKDIPFSSLQGKIIKNIKEITNEIEDDDDFNSDTETDGEDGLPYNDCRSPHLYRMTFKNSEEPFKFAIVNYSNGYYDGWITTSVVL